MGAVVLLLEGDILMPQSQESNSSAWWVLPVTQCPTPLSALSFQWLRLYPCLCSSMHLWWQSINEGDEKQTRTQHEPWNQLLATLGWTFTPLPYTGTVLKLQDPACNTTPSLKQNISCIGIKHLGNKISVLITVWAKVCVFFWIWYCCPQEPAFEVYDTANFGRQQVQSTPLLLQLHERKKNSYAALFDCILHRIGI